jgi:transcriptional regulator with GAF, ATPase, and Fis domain
MNSYSDKQELIFELASLLSHQSDFSEILRVISTKTAAIFNAEVASIVMINPRTQETLKTVIEKKKGIHKEKYQLIQTVIIGWVMKNKCSFLSNNLKSDSRFSDNLFKDFNIISAMCVPLKHRDKNIGYLTVLTKRENSNYDEDDVKLLERISDISAPHISNVQKIQGYFSIPLSNESILYKYQQVGLLGKSKKFIEMLHSIDAAAKCDVRVVLEGQTGTGKEVIAKAIHKLSSRAEHPFVAIDCGAIPENLVESELFGHVKGAFTGANSNRTGLIVEANMGTLFMDEVNNLPMPMQSKLLRVMQEGEVRPVGSNRKIRVNVRIISASSLSLSKQVENGEFREDLYFRLMVYPIYIPTLNERKRDVPVLADHFLNRFTKEQNKNIEFLHEDILEYLNYKNWAGNIRELENFIERLVTLSPNSSKILDVSLLPQNFTKEFDQFFKTKKISATKSLKDSLNEYEKNLVLKALEENDWNQNKAAKSLDLLEQTLRAKMKKLGIAKQ